VPNDSAPALAIVSSRRSTAATARRLHQGPIQSSKAIIEAPIAVWAKTTTWQGSDCHSPRCGERPEHCHIAPTQAAGTNQGLLTEAGRRVLERVQAGAAFDEAVDDPARKAEQAELFAGAGSTASRKA